MRKKIKAQKMTCQRCGAEDFSLYVSGCTDCGEDRCEKADALGKRPVDMVVGVDFTPNALCSECCPSGHFTKFTE